jgi:pilus assembly protein Flp/PilA
MSFVRRFLSNEDGATAIEYGLIVGLISIVIIVTVGAIGTFVEGRFNDVEACTSNTASAAAKSAAGC